MRELSIYIGCLCLVCSGVISAQQPFFISHPMKGDYIENQKNVLYEHSSGLLWFGTSDGLFSYDGIRWRIFERPDIMHSTNVTAIGEDGKGMLWVGYEDGTICYMDRNRKLVLWSPEEGLPKVPITGIAFGRDSTFWFSTYGEGLYAGRGKHIYNFNRDDGLTGNDIYAMQLALDNEIWLGTDRGISICSFDDDKKIVKKLTAADGLPDEIIRAMVIDNSGNFWLGTHEKGVCRYNREGRKIDLVVPIKNQEVVNCLTLYEGQELWIGTNNGLWRYSLTTGELLPLRGQEELIEARIIDLQKDKEGNTWVLSNAKEVFSANRQFERVDATISGLQAVFVDSENRIWAGTNHGLYLYGRDSSGFGFFEKKINHIPLNVISLFEDVHGNLWIGTYGEGIYCYGPSTGKIRHLSENDGVMDGNIFSIAGRENEVWIATLQGAVLFSLSGNILEGAGFRSRHYDHNTGLATDFIYTIFIDSRNRVWFGLDGEGVAMLENDKVTSYQNAGEITLKAIYSITEDDRGHLWFSSAGQGIFEFDGKNFEQLNFSNGSINPHITSLIKDKKGKILLVHPSGIDLLDPESRHITGYDDEIGVEDIDPNLNAVSSDSHGNIWIGTQDGLVRYTALAEEVAINPRTLINSVSIFLEPIDFRNKTSFDYNENYFVFDCIGLWYTDPSTVEYRYRLKGFDLDWKISGDHIISYPHLPPGSYLFQVQSTENGAFANEEVVEYSFSILAPFWKRWWFVAGSTLMAFGLLFWYIRLREQRLSRETRMKRDMVESELEALKSQINPHFLFNSFNTLITVIEEDPQIAVTYVQVLSDFYRSIIQYREKEVIPLAEEIRIVESYTFLLKQRYGDNLDLKVDLQGSNNHYVAPLTLQMLVENAIKHNIISKAKPLQIRLFSSDGYVTVENNLQMKSKPDSSTQFGLQSIARRYEYLTEKNVKIEKTELTFRVSIPLLKEKADYEDSHH